VSRAPDATAPQRRLGGVAGSRRPGLRCLPRARLNDGWGRAEDAPEAPSSSAALRSKEPRCRGRLPTRRRGSSWIFYRMTPTAAGSRWQCPALRRCEVPGQHTCASVADTRRHTDQPTHPVTPRLLHVLDQGPDRLSLTVGCDRTKPATSGAIEFPGGSVARISGGTPAGCRSCTRVPPGASLVERALPSSAVHARDHRGQATEPTKSAIDHARRPSAGSRAELGWWRACGWGRACQPVRPDRFHPGRGGRTRLPPRGPLAGPSRLLVWGPWLLRVGRVSRAGRPPLMIGVVPTTEDQTVWAECCPVPFPGIGRGAVLCGRVTAPSWSSRWRRSSLNHASVIRPLWTV
jgi:hypothetical protein